MSNTARPALVAHCDWSLDPRKRWMALAIGQGDQWHLGAPELVGETGSLVARLVDRRNGRGPILIGFDFPIGLPEAYGRLTNLPDFKTALRRFGTGDWAEWYDVCERSDQIRIARPFYPKRPGGTMRAHLINGLGFASGGELSRLCERATSNRAAACSLFWTLGGNQVGKAAITGWREVILPNFASASLWPFDGSLAELLASSEVVMAETYPGNVYHQMGISRQPRWSKRKQSDRARVGQRIAATIEARRYQHTDELLCLISDGFSSRPEGEDQFDAAVGLLGMLDVVDGHQPEMTVRNAAIIKWEGWIFGQTL